MSARRQFKHNLRPRIEEPSLSILAPGRALWRRALINLVRADLKVGGTPSSSTLLKHNLKSYLLGAGSLE